MVVLALVVQAIFATVLGGQGGLSPAADCPGRAVPSSAIVAWPGCDVSTAEQHGQAFVSNPSWGMDPSESEPRDLEGEDDETVYPELPVDNFWAHLSPVTSVTIDPDTHLRLSHASLLLLRARLNC